MQWYEILIIVAAACFVAGVAAWRIIRKKQGKSGCDCGCASCSGCCLHCKQEKKPQDKSIHTSP